MSQAKVIADDGARALALAGRFVGLAGALPQVSQVLLEETEDGPCIWTVIRAEPFDRDQREPVYSAELEALESYPDVGVNFRLINLAEYDDTSMTEVLPADAAVLWRREG